MSSSPRGTEGGLRVLARPPNCNQRFEKAQPTEVKENSLDSKVIEDLFNAVKRVEQAMQIAPEEPDTPARNAHRAPHCEEKTDSARAQKAGEVALSERG